MTQTDRKLRGYKQAKQLLALVSLYYPELAKANLTKIVARLSPARHSPDFRSVRWFGQSYSFTPAQALIVRELWKAWEHGTPKMGAATLLESAEMISDKVADLFKRNEAWGKMVCSDGAGNYWLSS